MEKARTAKATTTNRHPRKTPLNTTKPNNNTKTYPTNLILF
ncbi:MAG: hypothetical protein NWE95_03840 [Candidatus Bathyarchaeota archaeon]|nr:hypothetical protein [Candidatus Bathyarchaeota archaeon]